MRNTCIIWLAALILFVHPSFSQNTRTLAGTEFWMTFTENVYTPPDGVLHLVVAPATADTIRVFNPQLNYSESFPVKPGQQNNIALKFNYVWYSSLAFGAQGTGVKITSKRPVQIQAINRLDGSMDATSILPVSILENAREYVYSGLPGETGKEAQAAVLAMDTGTTTVEFILAADLSTGQGKGSSFTRNLKQGQVYVIQALGNQDLSGTIIRVKSGSCKKIALFAGTKCAVFQKTSGCTSCDAIYEQLWPANYFNKEYFVPPAPGNPNTGIGVVALQDNTTISVNGTAVKLLNRGEFYYQNTSGGTLVTADNLINCNQILLSSGCNGASPSSLGDPSVTQVAALEQSVNEALLPVFRNTKFSNYLVVYAEAATVPDIYLNGVLIAASLYQQSTPLGKTFWVATVALSANKTYKIESETPFIAYSYGMADAESYAAISAASFTNINADFLADPTVQCKKKNPIFFTGKGDSLGIISWFFGDGGTASGTNTSHIYNSIGTYKVKMLNSRPGSCPDTISRIVSILDGPDHSLPKDTAMCHGNIFRITLPVDKDYTYSWENGSNSFMQSITETRTAVLTTADTNGCISVDSIKVTFKDCSNYELKLSNVFTPGTDGFNDEWEIIYNGYTKVDVQILNRWGEVVCKYSLPENGNWNGMVNNQFTICPAGVYYYHLVARGRQPADDKTVSGAIELIR